jgi:ankyrin repeat protein
LAAAQGHKHIVTFLVNFGANIYSIDIDRRTAQELAGMNNREDILRFLDGVHAKMEAGDKKKAKAMKDKAKKDSEKRIKVNIFNTENNQIRFSPFRNSTRNKRKRTRSWKKSKNEKPEITDRQ